MADTCNIEPFRYEATPQPVGEENSTANQINEQQLEGYIARLLETICADLEAIEARLDALENP